jgi:hypothetical protein
MSGAERPVIRANATRESGLDDAHPMPLALVTDPVPAPVITSPLEWLAGFRPAVCCLSDFGAPAATAAPPDLIFFFLAPGCVGVFKRLNLTRAANQIRSHPRMSATRNLVSDRARRIPARVFKIHEQGALAMNFTIAAVREINVCVASATPLRRYFIQHVGVARNFDAEFE